MNVVSMFEVSSGPIWFKAHINLILAGLVYELILCIFAQKFGLNDTIIFGRIKT
jgi:hypothetical protein